MARRVLPWLLAAALLGAQLLGMMHRVVHAPHAQQAHAVHAAHAAVDALFSGHDESVCPLYDALGLDAAPLPLLALSLPVPAFVQLPFLLGEFLARRAALFEARGPPAAVS